MKHDKKIYIGIVLYNPDIAQLKKNINLLKRFDINLIFVDNNSHNINEIDKLVIQSGNIDIIYNADNYGIAKALNQILEWGRKRNFLWCLTLDQDSLITSTMINKMKKYCNIKNIGIITPLILDVNNMQNKTFVKNNIEFIEEATDVITSGSMINLKTAAIVGNYDERLFIDFVDTEFQERLLRKKYKIIRVNNAILYHQIGKIKIFKFFGKKIICTNHSALRRYYQVRNRLYYKKKYFGLLEYKKEKLRLIMGTFKIIIFETDVVSKIKFTFKAFKDYKKLL